MVRWMVHVLLRSAAQPVLVLTPGYLRIVALKKCNIFAKVFQKSIPGFQNSSETLFAFLTLDNFMGDERHRCPQIQP